VLVTKAVRETSDKIEETLTTRLDMGAMLDVVVRPEPAGRIIIAFVDSVSKLRALWLCFELAWFWSLIVLRINHVQSKLYAPEPARRCPDTEREPVPVAGNAEWPLPHARGNVPGYSQGQ
jgi:hypothetical protein